MNADGSNLRRLTHAKNKWDNDPAWAPDGKLIAFARAYKDDEGNWQQEIWRMNIDGTDQVRIGSLNGGSPDFTHDGKIVYHSKTETSEIYLANLDGSNALRLTHNDAEDWHPEVSPDGTQIAFMSNRDGNHEIYVMSIDGSKQKRLTVNETRDSTPTWSPDGKQILYSAEGMNSDSHLNIMNTDGSAMRRLVPNAGQPHWLKLRR